MPQPLSVTVRTTRGPNELRPYANAALRAHGVARVEHEVGYDAPNLFMVGQDSGQRLQVLRHIRRAASARGCRGLRSRS